MIPPISQRLAALLPAQERLTVLDAGSLGGGEAIRWGFLGDRTAPVSEVYDPTPFGVILQQAAQQYMCQSRQ